MVTCYGKSIPESVNSKVTSDNMQIWDAAFKIRQEIMNASSVKLPEHFQRSG